MPKIELELFEKILDKHIKDTYLKDSLDNIRENIISTIQEQVYWFLQEFGIYPHFDKNGDLIFNYTFDCASIKKSIVFSFNEWIEEGGFEINDLCKFKTGFLGLIDNIDKKILEYKKENE